MKVNLFETHWNATKSALCEGLTGNRKKVAEKKAKDDAKKGIVDDGASLRPASETGAPAADHDHDEDHDD